MAHKKLKRSVEIYASHFGLTERICKLPMKKRLHEVGSLITQWRLAEEDSKYLRGKLNEQSEKR